MKDLQFFFEFTLFLHCFLGIRTERNSKNPTWCLNDRSFEQNETLKTLIGLTDYCQACQPGSKMSFLDKHV